MPCARGSRKAEDLSLRRRARQLSGRGGGQRASGRCRVQMQVGKLLAYLLACLLAVCVPAGRSENASGWFIRQEETSGGAGGGGGSLHGIAGQNRIGQYLYVCVSPGRRRTVGLVVRGLFYMTSVCMCVSPGRRRRHADEVPRDLPRRRGDKQASKQANLATFHGNSREDRVCTAPRHDPRKRRRVSRLEAGRRYRRAHCLTLGVCCDDAVLRLRSPRGGLEEEGRDRGGDSGKAAGEEGAVCRWGLEGWLVITCLIGLLLPGIGVGELWFWWLENGEFGKWGHVCFSGWGAGGLFCFVSMSTVDSRGWVSCFSMLLGTGSPWLGQRKYPWTLKQVRLQIGSFTYPRLP